MDVIVQKELFGEDKHVEFKAEIPKKHEKFLKDIIANACLHRSYLDSSAIQVSVYDDRLEVDSPGMLYDGLNVKDALAGKSKCRNTAIAEAFQYMKIIEGWGTGLPRLFRQCREMGLPKPKFEELISQTRIAEEIGVSRSTVQRAFGKLIESGQVLKTGGTRGTWIIQEKY